VAIRVRSLHRWDLSYEDARRVQERLRARVRQRPLALSRVRRVAGADIAIDGRENRLIAAVVVLAFPSLDVLETRVAVSPLTFPYIPGLLSFREVPGLLACLETLRTPFDVILLDGQGIAHPRGLGLASHLGLAIGRPAVGCAKSRLVGEHRPPGPRRGDHARLVFEGRYVGSVLRTRDGVNPIYVSPGHLIDHPSSRRLALACCSRYRIPEPTRLAHIAAGAHKRRSNGSM
jgi:deoxyribonuclease V